jgi:hypothetical protein
MKFPNHRRRNTVGPWPLKRSSSEGSRKQQPLQILQDLHDVNSGGLSAALKAVDEECAFSGGYTGQDQWQTAASGSVVRVQPLQPGYC